MLSVVMDVAQPVAVEWLADVAQRTFGSIQLLCNNAGVGSSRWI